MIRFKDVAVDHSISRLFSALIMSGALQRNSSFERQAAMPVANPKQTTALGLNFLMHFDRALVALIGLLEFRLMTWQFSLTLLLNSPVGLAVAITTSQPSLIKPFDSNIATCSAPPAESCETKNNIRIATISALGELQ